MKILNRKHLKSKTFILLVILNLFIIANISAQEGAYWQGISVKNPAVIGTPSDWVFGDYAFTNANKLTPDDEEGPTGFALGVDYRVAPKIGSLGLFYTKVKSKGEVMNQIDMSYAYSIPFINGILNGGISFGIEKYKTELSQYELYNSYGSYGNDYILYGGDEGIEVYWGYGQYNGDYLEEVINSQLKVGFGLFYNSSKLDLGISMNRFFETGKNEESNPYNYNIKYTSNFITLLGAYRFKCIEKLVIEPNLMVDFVNEHTGFYPGIFFEYDDFVWIGYNNFDFNDLHSIILGVDILKRFRLGYSYSIKKLFIGKNVNLHEFLLGIRLDGI